MTEQHDKDRAFFGRRKGKGLRQGQAGRIAEALPALRLPEGPIQDLKALFPVPVEAIRLEIGFGGGEHLLARMRESPRIGFIGIEPFVNGMAKFLAAIEGEGLRNIRLWDGDAALLLPQLPEGSIDAVDLLYPDPWPKRRQRKRRFVSERTLALLGRVLRPGGRFRFASDIDDYVGWTLARLLASPDFDWVDETADDWRRPYPGWVRTRYEAKAVKAGRVPSYLTARRRAS
ncbi:tRNA (guanine(46)-N(7))-methyltransferase TrmB [Bosea sp. CS1GBMeth4]|uniref:tRNA (guanine(46)-N(7))-methyltransferase TrmB n=1 Tax=Bosea sp. CS1GBMeth4 TaxID=1892849 RepID=UPI0016477DA0|nr:tRNA (guanine(46)-N(7))-methyltransferase TrmB [Bosea sp. CS1GBMeth4]